MCETPGTAIANGLTTKGLVAPTPAPTTTTPAPTPAPAPAPTTTVHPTPHTVCTAE